MLTVKTVVKPAGRKGLGLFAAEFIPAGKVWWRDDRLFNRIFSKAEVDSFPPLTQKFLDTYASLKSDGSYYLCNDDARFVNHSDNPNTTQQGGGDADSLADWITTKDVAVGEEITSDYREFCLTCKDGLCFKNEESALQPKTT